MTPLAAYLLLFVAVGVGFVFIYGMAGKLIRTHKPDAVQGTPHECGESPVESARIPFDPRFYMVALLFLIFEVGVTFFFPWAVVFGKANAISNLGTPTTAEDYHRIGEKASDLLPPAARAAHASQHAHLMNVKPEDVIRLQELKAKRQTAGKTLTKKESMELDDLEYAVRTARNTQEQARLFAWLAFAELAIFFGVILVGFAYLWRRGDLSWVRGLTVERGNAPTVTA